MPGSAWRGDGHHQADTCPKTHYNGAPTTPGGLWDYTKYKIDLRSRIPNISFGSNITFLKQLFITPSIARLHVNFNLSIIVFCAFLSNTLIIANPEISSTSGASTFINFCSFCFKTICFLGNLFRKLKT